MFVFIRTTAFTTGVLATYPLLATTTSHRPSPHQQTQPKCQTANDENNKTADDNLHILTTKIVEHNILFLYTQIVEHLLNC